MIVYAALAFAVFGVGIILYIAMKAFRTPTVFYATEEPIDELSLRLSCPKCRTRRLKPTGRYTLECDVCGFSFSIGSVRRKEIE